MWHHKPIQGVPINWAHPLSKALVGYWPFNENSGDLVNDLSGNTSPVVISGPAWVPGRDGPALSFDGGDYIDTGRVILPSADDFTIVAWIYFVNTATSRTIIGQYASGQAGRFIWYIDPSEKLTVSSGGATKAQSGVLAAGWHHVVLARTVANNQLYIDGVADDLDNNLANLYQGINTFIGAEDSVPAFGYEGIMSEVLIYNRFLLANEVQQLFSEPHCFMQQPFSPELWYIPAVGVGVVPQIEFLRMHTL